MALRLSVLAKDVKTESRWMDELRGQLRLVSDIELGAVSGGVAPGELILVDGSDPEEISDLLARFPAEVRRQKAFCLMVPEGATVPPELLDGQVDDVLIYPFRNPELLVRIHQLGRALQWKGLESVSRVLGETVEQLREDLALATRLQKSSTPTRFQDVRGFRFASRYLAGLRAGGDYFDLAEAGDSRQLSLLLSDASSHGLSSAVLGALMKVALKLSADDVRSVGETVRRIFNEVLVALSERDHLSLFYGVLSRRDLKLRYLNLGNSRAFHAPEGQPFRELARQGEPITRAKLLGQPVEGELQLHSNDRLVLLSDGFVDAAGGPEGALALLNQFRSKEALDAVNEFTFRVKQKFSSPEDLPAQDCSILVADVDVQTLRLAT